MRNPSHSACETIPSSDLFSIQSLALLMHDFEVNSIWINMIIGSEGCENECLFAPELAPNKMVFQSGDIIFC